MQKPAHLINNVYLQTEACSILGISRPTLRKLIREGKIGATRESLTSRLYILKADIDAIVASYAPQRPGAKISNEK